MPPSYKDKIKLQRESDILTTAARLIHDKGFANFSMDELADEVGVSKPTLYQHFSSKEDLGAEVLIRALGTFGDVLQSLPEGRTIDKLATVMRRMLKRRYSTDNVLTTGPEMFMTLRTHPALIQHRIEVVRYLRELVEAGQQDGSVVNDLPAPVIVNAMLGLMGSLSKHFSPTEEFHIDDMEQAIEAIIRLLMHGIKADRVTEKE